MNFAVVRREATLVRFESPGLFVNVYHGRASFQIGVEIGRVDTNELYSLHEVLTVFAPDEIDNACYQTTSANTLEQYLMTIATTLESKCRILLTGDAGAFTLLQQATSGSRQAATLQAQFGAVIDQADDAWEQKNHNRAVELYEAAELALDETRRRRLEYLRQKKKKRGE
jgi:hypothetical protein